jgi:hypothetical protein
MSISHSARFNVTIPAQTGSQADKFQNPNSNYQINTNIKIRSKEWILQSLVRNQRTEDFNHALSPLEADEGSPSLSNILVIPAKAGIHQTSPA